MNRQKLRKLISLWLLVMLLVGEMPLALWRPHAGLAEPVTARQEELQTVDFAKGALRGDSVPCSVETTDVFEVNQENPLEADSEGIEEEKGNEPEISFEKEQEEAREAAGEEFTAASAEEPNGEMNNESGSGAEAWESQPGKDVDAELSAEEKGELSNKIDQDAGDDLDHENEEEAETHEEPEETLFYGEEDFYNLSIRWLLEETMENEEEALEREPVTFVFVLEYWEEELEWVSAASVEDAEAYSAFLSLRPGDRTSARISLAGLPVEREYRARLKATEGYQVNYEDSLLSTHAVLETVQGGRAFALGFGITPFLIVDKELTLSFELDVTLADGTGAVYDDVLTVTMPDNSPYTVEKQSGQHGIVYKVTFTSDAADNISYSIVVEGADFDLHPKGAITGVYPHAEPIKMQAYEYASHVLEKKWNDNNWDSRPSGTKFQLKMQDNHTLQWDDFGEPFSFPLDDHANSQTHTFTHLPSMDGNKAPRKFKVEEIPEGIDGYAVEYVVSSGKTVITNTRKTSLTFDKVWHDIGAPGARPSGEDWKAGLTLHRRNHDGTEVAVPGLPTLTISGSDTWKTTFDNLPMYDENGQLYTYFVTEDTEAWEETGEYGEYTTKHENTGEHMGQTDKIYNGGSSTSLIGEIIQFDFTKTWADGEETERPILTFELYRAPVDPQDPTAHPSISEASPVPGMDKMVIDPNTSGDFSSGIVSADFIYSSSGNTELPRYGQEGREYRYFLVEHMSGNTKDYVQVLEDEDAYLYPGKTITNRKQTTVYPPVTKEMNARALQDTPIDVTFGLENSVTPEDETSFAPVEGATLTISDFSAEKRVQTAVFAEGYDGYDEDGYPYTYRTVEKSVTIGGVTGYADAAGRIQVGDYTFEMTVDAGGMITNTLVGETAIGVKKTWSPDKPANPTVTLQLFRDGAPFLPSPLPTLEGWDVDLNGTEVVITRTDAAEDADFELLFGGLEKYDEGGRLYEYTVEEVACTAGYVLDELNYTKVTDDTYGTYHRADIANVKGGEPCLVFHVNKVWLDDGDSGHRETVTIGVFYDENEGTGTPSYVQVGASVSVAEADVWTKRFTYTPSVSYDVAAPEWDYDNYILREIEVGTGNEVVYSDMVGGTGKVEATNHWYAVSHEKTGEGRFAIANLRVGTVNVVIDKVWHIGDQKDLDVEFTLYGDGFFVEKILFWGASQVVFAGADDEGLPKYDAQGAVIPYTASETGIRLQGGSFVPFGPDNSVTLPGVGRIVKSFSKTGYTVGSKHTGDEMSYLATNTRRESDTLRVNKVWRDEGNPKASRPDISLILARVSAAAPEAAPEVITNAQRDWNTGLDQWFWECDFGVLPRYDAQGYAYEYRVTEHIAQTGLYYSITYYKEGTQPIPDAGAVSSENIFAIIGDDAYARADFDGEQGTVINTIQRKLTINGVKLWEHIPSWYPKTELPTAEIELYRYTAEAPMPVYVGTVSVENGATEFEFENLDMYTAYGIPYSYELEEDPLLGYSVHIDNADFTVSNIFDDPSTPRVTITVDKEWDWTARDATQINYPDVTFELWQYLDGKSCGAQAFKTHTITGGTIPGDTLSVSFAFSDLPYYAPDGKPFTYMVKEVPALGGYETAVFPADGEAELNGSDAAGYTGAISFTNTYKPENQENIAAHKVWVDEKNKFGLRPAFSLVQTELTYALFRKLPGKAEEDISSLVDGLWALDGTVPSGADDRWICTFTPNGGNLLPLYTTMGEKYTYYVKEVLAAPYNDLYKQQEAAGTHSLTLHNKLETVQASFTKKWVDQDELRIPPAHLRPMIPFGLPGTITFTLQQSEDAATWFDYESAGQKVIHTYPIVDLVSETKITFPEHLPKYWLDGVTPKEYDYKIVETDMAAPSIAVVATAVPDSLYHTNITNKIAVRKLFFVKNWIDENNQDGKRPATITYTVHEKDMPAATADVILSKNTTSSDPSTDGAHELTLDGDRWRAELWLPEDKPGAGGTAVYDVSERSPGDYHQVKAETEGNYWFSFDNSRQSNFVDIQVEKNWTNETPWTVRPAEIEVTLQVRAADSSVWYDVGDALTPAEYGMPVVTNPQRISGAATGAKWETVAPLWEGLPTHKHKKTASEAMVALAYQVVEKTSPGYVSASVSRTPGSSTGEISLSLTNTFQTVDISGNKTWVDDSDIRRVRPSDITLEVYGDGALLNPQPANLHWNKTAGTDVWFYQVNDLPSFRADGTTRVEYTVKETALFDYTVSYSAGTVNSVTGDVTGLNLENALICALNIDNTTLNQANGNTNAGGFVNIDSTADIQRDILLAPNGGTSVYWKPELNWRTGQTVQVAYYNYGDPVQKVVTFTPENGDISALQADFPDAALSGDETSGYTLIFANNILGMPRLTEVKVGYIPTIAGINISPYNNSGEVSVENGTWSPTEDGVADRYSEEIVLEKSMDGYVADMNGIRIGVPGDVSQGKGTLIRPDGNGNFSVNLQVMLAGLPETVTITGRLVVTRRNPRGEPLAVSVILNNMPVPLDIGVSFIPQRAVTAGTPQTGDVRDFAYYYALLGLGVMMMGTALLLLRRKKWFS